MMKSYINFLNNMSQWAAWLGGAMILCVGGITVVDVFSRLFFNLTIGGADELSGFALAMSLAWGLSYCLFQRAHIRIDTVYLAVPRWIKATCDVLGLSMLITFFALLAWFSCMMFIEAYVNDTHTVSRLAIPLKYPMAVWVLGLLFFTLCGLSLLIAALSYILRGDIRGAQKLIGSKSLAEELEEEKAALDIQRDEEAERCRS